MARRIPHVAWDVLTAESSRQDQPIKVDSAAWYRWLETATTFLFESPAGSFTARRERASNGRGGWYWRAYRRRAGSLKRAYLGTATDLTLARLHTTAARLVDAEEGAERMSVAPTQPPPPAEWTPPLLMTKLAGPQVAAHRLSRPRLLAHLDAGLQVLLTVVAAPAGFGKTTLLGDWLDSRTFGGTADRHISGARLSLEPADNDPTTFLRYLIAAFQTIDSTVGASALQLLQTPGHPSLDRLMALLVVDLTALPGHIVLILDDYHVIVTAAIHAAVAWLLEHLPARCHLVLATREDPPLPLARLRARGQLVEMRAPAMRFTEEETAIFLTETMGLPLAHFEVRQLEQRTEGWIAGLHLASVALHNRSDHERFIAGFSGNHRYIVDYLVDEVLATLPDSIQSFLLQTSILDRLSGSLCDAVLAGQQHRWTSEPAASNLSSGDILVALERRNLFLNALDDDRAWYRYHHLFADVLRARLMHSASREDVADLQRRASAWYEQAQLGHAAVQHALAAQDWQLATRLIMQFLGSVWSRGEIQTVDGWLNALPEAVIAANHDLSMTHAATLIFTEQRQRAQGRLEDAERAIEASVPGERVRSAQGAVAAMRAIVAHARGDLAGLIDHARQALALLREGQPYFANALLGSAHAFLITGNVQAPLERMIRTTIAPHRARGDFLPLVHCYCLLARLYMLRGRLEHAAAEYAGVIAVMPRPSDMPLLVSSTPYYVGMATLHYERNQLERAAECAALAMTLIRGPVVLDADTLLRGYLVYARVSESRGKIDDARAALDELAATIDGQSVASLIRRRAAAARAAFDTRQGAYARAADWVASCGLNLDDAPTFIDEAEYLTLARVHLALQGAMGSTDQLPKVAALLDQLLEAAEGDGRVGSSIEILLLRARVFNAQAQPIEARASLEQALALAEPAGYVRSIVDEGETIAELLRDVEQGQPSAYRTMLMTCLPGSAERALSAAPELPSQTGTRVEADGLVESLTPRERDVLRLVVAGASNRMIADTLVISIGTAKKHVNNILGKLQLENRTQAAIWAREHGAGGAS